MLAHEHDYTDRIVIKESDTIRLERVEEGGRAIVIKALLDISHLSFLYSEFNILTNALSHCDAVRGAIRKTRVDGKLSTVLEWAEGCTLKEWIQENPLPTVNDIGSENLMIRVKLASAITSAVSKIHECGVVHNDLTIENIIIDMQDNKFSVQIISFGQAVEWSRTTKDDKIEGINFDIKILGSTFSHLFFGIYENMEVSDREATVVTHRNAPNSIIYFIACLLHASDFYDVAYTSLKDVELDLQQMLDLPEIFLWDRSEENMRRTFDFSSQNLYGRDKEIAIILDAFHRINNSDASPELILLSGHSGTGKSAIIDHLPEDVKSMGGHFVTGKFNQLRASQPYTALISALGHLCDLLSQKNRTELNEISFLIKKAVGDQGRVLTDVIPRLESIIGKQPEVNETRGIEAQNRLVFLLRMFVRAISKASSLIVISLHDLQWADGESLDLIRMLVTDSANHSFLFVGTYRYNEVTDMHPLAAMLREIEKRSIKMMNISIGNLALPDVMKFISAELGMQQRFVRQLATTIFGKTEGNVFFVMQIMVFLFDRQLLTFVDDHWEWDDHEISGIMTLFESMDDLVLRRIKQCSTGAKNILQVAAVIGFSFDESTIMSAIEYRESTWVTAENNLQMESYSRSEVRAYINEAIRKGLVLATEVPDEYMLAHDSIQAALYSLLSSDKLTRLHIKIGSQLLEELLGRVVENGLFFAVDHLNKGSKLIQNDKAKRRLAKLNLQAAQKAIKSSAFNPATEYLRTGIGYLSHNHWENEYDLSLELFTSMVECLYCTGNFDEVEELVEHILAHARHFADQERAHLCLIKCLTGKGQLENAMDVGFEALAQVGERFPQSVNTRVIFIDLVKTKFMLAGKSDKYLSTLPPMKNKDKLAAMKIISNIAPSMFYSRPDYFVLLLLRVVRLSLRFGSCNETANAFTVYGMFLGTGLGQYKSGYRFGQLGLTIVERLESKEWLAGIYFLVYSSINHWVIPLEKSIEPLTHANRVGMETGAVEFAGYSADALCIQSFVSGQPLKIVEYDMQILCQQMVEYSIVVPLSNLIPYRQCVHNLMGRSENPVKLTGDVMSEEMQTDQMKQESNKYSELAIYVNIVWLSYLFGEYTRAGEFVEKLLNAKVIGSQIEEALKVFSCGLTCFALARKEANETKWLERGMKSLKTIKRWSHFCPSTFLQKKFLLQAEKAFLKKRHDKAHIYYEKSIHVANQHGFLNDEALANERYGIFLDHQNKDATVALYRFARATELYEMWGALGKVKHIRGQFMNSHIISGRDS